MKKVGILTFHRAHNYGAVLQCYALQEVLKSIGNDVQIIDYRQPYIEKRYAPFLWCQFFELFTYPRGMFRYFRSLPARIRNEKIFSAFTEKWLTRSNPCDKSSIPQDIDTYIVGSDQLWGLHCTGGIQDPIYFGNFKRNESSKIIGYAISANHKSIEDISIDELKKCVANFSTLSFREAIISDFVFEKSGAVSRVDIDPTLLTDASTWEAMVNENWAKEKYVLLYQVRWPKIDNKLLNRKANELAKQLDCRVIDLSNMNYSVEDFVSAFKYAQCVITSSFHASVFSIIFERPLQAVMLRDGHDGRYENILKAIEADRMLVEMDFTPKVVKVDYVLINSNLCALQQKSLSYLKVI